MSTAIFPLAIASEEVRLLTAVVLGFFFGGGSAIPEANSSSSNSALRPMALSGLRTSCARPAVRRPMTASDSASAGETVGGGRFGIVGT